MEIFQAALRMTNMYWDVCEFSGDSYLDSVIHLCYPSPAWDVRQGKDQRERYGELILTNLDLSFFFANFE